MSHSLIIKHLDVIKTTVANKLLLLDIEKKNL